MNSYRVEKIVSEHRTQEESLKNMLKIMKKENQKGLNKFIEKCRSNDI